MKPADLGVHLSHCCAVHGCKYGDDDCPVELKLIPQQFPCEFCPKPTSAYLDKPLRSEREAQLGAINADLLAALKTIVEQCEEAGCWAAESTARVAILKAKGG